MIWVGQIVQGVLLGGYYALIACGLSFMFGTLRVINLAHGALAVLAAYLILLLAETLELNPFAGLVAVIPVMAAIGWLLQRSVIERSLRAGPLVPLLSTFGLAIVIENALFEQFGADTRSLAPFVDSLAYDSWELPFGIYVGQLSLLIFAAAVLLLGGLHLFLARTALGRQLRATAQDPDTAELVGINARRTYAAATAIAMATVAVAGAALAMRATFDPYAGQAQLIFAFEATVIGGIGSLWGTLLGGIVIGVAQSIGSQIRPQGFLIAGHGIFLCFLIGRLVLAGRDRRWMARVVTGRRP